jgi:transcriptional regulator with XRE-family HTH domain
MAAGKKPQKRSEEQISGRSADYQAIGAWLKDRRQEAGLGQLEVNRVLGKSNTFLYRVEHGQQRIDLLQFLDLARVLKLDPQITLKSLWQITRYGARERAQRGKRQ